MNQVMPAKTLDLKSMKTATGVKRKDKDESFRKELDKKERKSSDRDELSAHHHTLLERRNPIKSSADSAKSSLKSKTAEKIAKTSDTSSSSKAATQKSAPEKTVSEKVEPESTDSTQKNGISSTQKSIGTRAGALNISNGTAIQEVAVSSLQLAEMLPGQQIVEQMPGVQELAPSAVAIDGMTLMNPELLPATLNDSSAGLSPDSLSLNGLTEPLQSHVGFQDKSFGSDTQSSADGFSSGTTEVNPDILNSAVQTPLKNEPTFDAVIKAAVLTPTDATRDTNMENIVQSARTLLRDGGGEMQIKLNPDGLGSVDLKVGVQAGEVSIEILAQDKSVQKMFEDGLGDIRSALELQNLKIDSFKVDVSQRAEQNATDLQQEAMSRESANREFARDFMNQFRGERQAFRGQTVGYEMERAPDFSKSPEGLRPASSSASSPNGRLNLIA